MERRGQRGRGPEKEPMSHGGGKAGGNLSALWKERGQQHRGRKAPPSPQQERGHLPPPAQPSQGRLTPHSSPPIIASEEGKAEQRSCSERKAEC